jgi:hypothetical protein
MASLDGDGHRSLCTGLALVLCLAASGLGAQELSPRSYWPAPKGTRALILGSAYAWGDVVTDRALPVSGVDSRITTGIVGYFETFELAGRTANFVLELPYSSGTTEGLLFGVPARRDFSGFGDLAVTVGVNLIGAPSMSLEEFREFRANPHPLLAMSVKVVVPSGKYERGRLINVGGHRWAAKLELGHVLPMRKRWLLELEAGVWFFDDDEDFVLGRREQDPILAAEAHVVRRIRPGLWGSLELNYYTGGSTTIAGVHRADLQRNARLGGTLVLPFRRRHAVKIGYSRGILTETGSDFDQALVSYQVLLR